MKHEEAAKAATSRCKVTLDRVHYQMTSGESRCGHGKVFSSCVDDVNCRRCLEALRDAARDLLHHIDGKLGLRSVYYSERIPIVISRKRPCFACYSKGSMYARECVAGMCPEKLPEKHSQ